MEAFFSSVKSELADRFDSCGEAKMELFDYIEVFYNQGAPALNARSDQSGRVRAPSGDSSGVVNPSTKPDQAHWEQRYPKLTD